MPDLNDPLLWVPRPADGVASRLVEGAAVALTESDQTLHTFQGDVATQIWARIDGSRTVKQILDDVLSSFEVDHTRALDDLLEFMHVLKDRGLIVVTAPLEGPR